MSPKVRAAQSQHWNSLIPIAWEHLQGRGHQEGQGQEAIHNITYSDSCHQEEVTARASLWMTLTHRPFPQSPPPHPPNPTLCSPTYSHITNTYTLTNTLSAQWWHFMFTYPWHFCLMFTRLIREHIYICVIYVSCIFCRNLGTWTDFLSSVLLYFIFTV